MKKMSSFEVAQYIAFSDECQQEVRTLIPGLLSTLQGLNLGIEDDDCPANEQVEVWPDDLISSTSDFRKHFACLEIISKQCKIFRKESDLESMVERLRGARKPVTKPSSSSIVNNFGKHDALCVTISFEAPDVLQGSEEIRTSFKFSSIPYAFPRNKLCEQFGSDNFLIVKFQTPSMQIHDIHFFHNETTAVPKQASTKDGSESQQLFIQMMFQKKQQQDTSQQQKADRFDIYKQLSKVEFSDSLKIEGREYVFLCCNITGALTHKFIYVNKEIFDKVLDWAFDVEHEFNQTKVFKKERPLVVPLRLSLLNSTSVKTIELDEEDTITIPDICIDGISFTDGCGVVTDETVWKNILNSYNPNVLNQREMGVDELVGEANASFLQLDGNDHHDGKGLSYDLPPKSKLDNYLPSAIQIRYRGFKGMLVYYPDKENLNKEMFTQDALEKKVIFTESMKKFEPGRIVNGPGIHNQLNVVGMSLPARPVMLSSEIIYLLSGLVDEKNLLAYLRSILFEKRLDVDGESPLDSIFRDSEIMKKLFQKRADLFENFMDGKDLRESIFLLLGSQTFQQYLLKLSVPMPKTAYLYGVADFTGTLEEGQIFLQVTLGEETQVIEGDMCMTKTPALLRTDMQRFTAVKCEKLNHVKDVVVFSTKGKRFAPSTMSGADLDGDHFHIFWDENLVKMIHVYNIQTNPEVSLPTNEQTNTKNEVSQTESISESPVATNEHLQEDTTIEQTHTCQDVPTSRTKHLLKEAFKLLVEPITSHEYCTMNRLLEARRRFIDSFGGDWASKKEYCEVLDSISNALNDTFTAPKHGKWVKWETLKELIGSVPPFPHYASNFAAKTPSQSIYGILYEELLERVVSLIGNQDEMSLEAEISSTSLLLQMNLWIMRVKGELFKRNELLDIVDRYFKSLTIRTKDDVLKISAFVSLFYRQILRKSTKDSIILTDQQWKVMITSSSTKQITHITEYVIGLLSEEDVVEFYKCLNELLVDIVCEKYEIIFKYLVLLPEYFTGDLYKCLLELWEENDYENKFQGWPNTAEVTCFLKTLSEVISGSDKARVTKILEFVQYLTGFEDVQIEYDLKHELERLMGIESEKLINNLAQFDDDLF